MFKNFLIILKWKYSRCVVKRNRIGFHWLLARMHWIQELEKLPQYKQEELGRYGDRRLRRMFAKEFPDKHLHNPSKD